jgi:WD domain, G-beta repeat
MGKPVPGAVPERLRRLNYIFFREGQSFVRPLAELAGALRQDVEWIREHTRLGQAASRWQARTRVGGAAGDLLLRGDDLTDAKAWADRRKEDAPEITAPLRSFLDASEDLAAVRADRERRRLDERARLISETEVAQANIRRIQRRSFMILTGFLLLVMLGTGVGLWSVFAGWRELMFNRSQFIAGIIDKEAGEGGYVDAMLLGLDALPDNASTRISQRMVPLEASARFALDRAWRDWTSHWGERKLLADTAAVSAVAFSPDGKRVLTGSYDNTARLWDAATGEAVATLKGHTAQVLAVAFSPDGRRVLTGSNDHTARLWDLPTAQELVEKVKARVPRCLTPAQREGFHLGTATPRWCYARNLWPYADHGTPQHPKIRSLLRSCPGCLGRVGDRDLGSVTGWFARPDTRSAPLTQYGTK